jgi:hypothetical protein
MASEFPIREYHASMPNIDPETEEALEREWDQIVQKENVKRALAQMADEARRQLYAGETEEGGFGLE